MVGFDIAGRIKGVFELNRIVKTVVAAFLLAVLPVLALAEGPVMLVDLPESAQMIENVEFDNGDFIQSYQLEDGASVQLLRYTGFTMTMEELIASDWPVNARCEMDDTMEVSGYPAQRAHIWQPVDEGGYPVKAKEDKGQDSERMMEIDLILVTVEHATLIYQDIYFSDAHEENAQLMINSLSIQGAENAEVG